MQLDESAEFQAVPPAETAQTRWSLRGNLCLRRERRQQRFPSRLGNERLGEPHRLVEPAVERLARNPERGGSFLAREASPQNGVEAHCRLPQRLEILTPRVVQERSSILRRQVGHA